MDLQISNKQDDEVGWEAYQLCQKAGAIIANAHSHTYSRSLTLTKIGDKSHNHGESGIPEVINLGQESTFVFVSGLGGFSQYSSRCDAFNSQTWWASTLSANYQMQNKVVVKNPCIDNAYNEMNFGALFISFKIDGNAKLARGIFKTIDNRVIDDFLIQRN